MVSGLASISVRKARSLLRSIFLRPLAFGNVFDHADVVHGPARRVVQQRNRQFAPHGLAVFAKITFLRAIDLKVAEPEAGNEGKIPRPIVRVSEALQAEGEDFVLRVAEHFAETPVDAEEAAVRADQRQSDRTFLENGAKSLFALPQRPLRPPSLGDVEVDPEDAADSLFFPNGGDNVEKVSFFALNAGGGFFLDGFAGKRPPVVVLPEGKEGCVGGHVLGPLADALPPTLLRCGVLHRVAAVNADGPKIEGEAFDGRQENSVAAGEPLLGPAAFRLRPPRLRQPPPQVFQFGDDLFLGFFLVPHGTPSLCFCALRLDTGDCTLFRKLAEGSAAARGQSPFCLGAGAEGKG